MSEVAKPEIPTSESTSVNVSEKGNSVVEPKAIDEDGQSQADLVHTPHLHAKTFLAVFAVCLIYVAQTFTLVGAGAVCLESHILSYCHHDTNKLSSKGISYQHTFTDHKMSLGSPRQSQFLLLFYVLFSRKHRIIGAENGSW